MSGLKEQALKLWHHKKARNTILLSLIVVVLIFSLIRAFNIIVERARMEMAAKVFICTKCEYQGVMLITDIQEIKCPKCASNVGYGWKCRSCSREFAVRPQKITRVMTKKELMLKQKMESQCPNCGSFDTFPFPITLKEVR